MILVGGILLGVILRYSLLPYGDIKSNGDLSSFAEWGMRLTQSGTKSFYSSDGWNFSSPNYPPLSSLMYGFTGWMFDQRHILSQLHNKIRIPPSSFIIDFYANGYNFILKLPIIVFDIGLGILIYRIIYDLTRNEKKASLGTLLYLFNPITLFLAGIWGQAESVVAFFAILSFLALLSKKVWLSIPLLFISLYIKPTWGLLLPLYLFLLFQAKPRLKEIFLGLAIAGAIFYLTTKPFTDGNLISFALRYVVENILPGSRGTARASISAFNLWSVFMRIDQDLATSRFLFTPANILGIIFYILVNLFAFKYLKREKNKLLGIVVGIFVVGMGSFLFLTNMLERYFFTSFTFLIVLVFAKPKLAIYLLTMNIILFLGLIWAFYRRTSDEIGRPFTNNGFLVIRTLSFVNVISYIRCLKRLS